MASGPSHVVTTAGEGIRERVDCWKRDGEYLKAHAFAALALESAEAAACGDDLPDFPLFDACGFCACPGDAPSVVRERVDLVLERPGGRGAVREFVEEVLRRNDAEGR